MANNKIPERYTGKLFQKFSGKKPRRENSEDSPVRKFEIESYKIDSIISGTELCCFYAARYHKAQNC